MFVFWSTKTFAFAKNVSHQTELKLAKFLQLFLENYIPYIPDKDNVK